MYPGASQLPYVRGKEKIQEGVQGGNQANIASPDHKGQWDTGCTFVVPEKCIAALYQMLILVTSQSHTHRYRQTNIESNSLPQCPKTRRCWKSDDWVFELLMTILLMMMMIVMMVMMMIMVMKMNIVGM